MNELIDNYELMAVLSRPRPNGSAAIRETRSALINWMDSRRIPHRQQRFKLYPYFFECIGVWLILSRTLLVWAVWARWSWLTLLVAILGLIGGVIDVVMHWPVITWPGGRIDENILIEFPSTRAENEVILSAHYDTKTELLDHRQRLFFLKNLKPGMLLTLALGVLSIIDVRITEAGSIAAPIFHWFVVILCLPMLFLAWGLGLNLTLGRLIRPSQGAADDGAACAILLGLAKRISCGDIQLDRTNVTLALFTGEEVNMQGSRAYIRGREWSLPTQAINLEVMAQDGEYVYWEQDGFSLHLEPTTNSINKRVIQAITLVTSKPPLAVGPVNSDGYSFLAAGIPATTIGTYDKKLRDCGFHRPTDNLDRVVMSRLEEGIEILMNILRDCDRGRTYLSIEDSITK